MGVESGAPDARARALAVLRVRSRAVAVALLPAALAVILLAGATSDHLVGGGWDAARVVTSVVAAVVLLAALGIAVVVARARPALSPTVPVAEESAPDLYRLVRDLADRLDVPAPSAIALTPDCDSWLEDRTHPAHGPPRRAHHDEIAGAPGLVPGARRTAAAPVLVIGSPFLWWMRVGELRAVLAPVVAGTGPSAHPDIAAARRFVRGLDAAVAVCAAPGRRPVARWALAGVGWTARLLLRGCRDDAAEMERGVAAAAATRAQAVDYGLRIVAQEQVGLAYAGWDRLLTRVALPAWRMGRWPSRLDAGVVSALTELSRRDRLAEGFASRLGERPACDLLEEPGLVDEAASLLAARLFHGGPAEHRPDWSPVDWQDYPDEVVDRTWRTDAARLHRVLDRLGVRRYTGPAAPHSVGPTLARVLDHLSTGPGTDHHPAGPGAADRRTSQQTAPADPGPGPGSDPEAPDAPDAPETTERGAVLAAGLSAELAREEATAPTGRQHPGPAGAGADAGPGSGTPLPLWDDGTLPLFPLQPPRTGRDLLADHVTAMVCCAAVDTAGATPGLDWLDGPSLLVGGERAADLGSRVLTLVEEGDPAPLREWLTDLGIRPEKPVRLV
ncbi:M48 family metalloprotease [Streptomyces sp. YIM S03343]